MRRSFFSTVFVPSECEDEVDVFATLKSTSSGILGVFPFSSSFLFFSTKSSIAFLMIKYGLFRTYFDLKRTFKGRSARLEMVPQTESGMGILFSPSRNSCFTVYFFNYKNTQSA